MGFRVLADKAPVFSGFGVKLLYGAFGAWGDNAPGFWVSGFRK